MNNRTTYVYIKERFGGMAKVKIRQWYHFLFLSGKKLKIKKPGIKTESFSIWIKVQICPGPGRTKLFDICGEHLTFLEGGK